MESYKTIWKKDVFFRTCFLLVWIILLFLINWLIIFFLNWWSISLWYYGFIALSAFFFYKIYRLFNNIKYEFTSESIIVYSGRKKYTLFLKKIDKLEKIINIPIINLFGIRYNPVSKELFFLTSYQNIIKIYMNDGEKIYISPKRFDEDTFNFYNNNIKWKK